MTKKTKTTKPILTEPVRKKFRIDNGERRRVQVEFKEPSMTKQAFGPECDIRNIMRKFVRTGEMPGINSEPQYGDQPDTDFVEAAYNQAILRSKFEELPTELQDQYRDEFGMLNAMLAEAGKTDAGESAFEGQDSQSDLPFSPAEPEAGTADNGDSQSEAPSE